MGTKKIKISSIKRAAHLKSKKLSTKCKATQNDKNIFMKKHDVIHKKNKKKEVENSLLKNDYDSDLIYEDVADMLDGDDFDYLQTSNIKTQRKRRQNFTTNQETDAVELEKVYTNENAMSKESKKVKINLLPIKSRDGNIITRSTEIDYKAKSKLDKIKEETLPQQEKNVLEYEDSDDDIVNNVSIEMVKDEPEKRFISTTDLLIAREQEIERQKYRIGIICSGILEKPQDKMRNFNALFELMDDNNTSGAPNLLTIRRLTIISLTEVFKDILPEYRVGQVDIKLQTVRKTTLERAAYENSLLQVFKKFLLKLEKFTAAVTKRNQKKITTENVKLAEIAVDSLCEMLVAHTYFNYVQNIAQLLVYMLNSNFSKIREIIHRCFRSVFINDTKLDMSLYIVRRINNLIKKSHNVHIECISCLLSLKIKNVNLDAEKENAIKQKKLEAHRQRLLFLSKKERKRRKKLVEVNKELEETKAEENKQMKFHKITELIKMVFTIYFRILKTDPTSKLLCCILEGLAEFAHLINIDFFADLIDVLNKIIERQQLGYREKLYCIQTIFIILSGQGEILNIDPIRFYQHFYANMFVINAGKNHNDYRIVLKTLDEVLVKRKRNISSQRLMAFIKRLLTSCMQLLHHGTLATLGTVKIAFQLTSVIDILLDTDLSIGSGSYDSQLEDPEYCNASCTALYELTKLTRHYHPSVRKMAVHIANGVPATGDGCLSSDLGKLTPHELFEQFDSTEMIFNPVLPVPRQTDPKFQQGKHSFIQKDFKNYFSQVLNRSTKPDLVQFDFYTSIQKH